MRGCGVGSGQSQDDGSGQSLLDVLTHLGVLFCQPDGGQPPQGSSADASNLNLGHTSAYPGVDSSQEMTSNGLNPGSVPSMSSGSSTSSSGQGNSASATAKCSQYDSECAQSGQTDQYACLSGDCCRAFGNSAFANCTRNCLLGFESGACFGSPNSGVCRLEAHVACYWGCSNGPRAALSNSKRWLDYPACRKLQPLIIP